MKEHGTEKKLRILFWGTSEQYGVVSAGVHVTEVLNNLTHEGHTVVFADGKVYEPIDSSAASTSKPNQGTSVLARAKRLIMSSPLRGEALVASKFLKETRLARLASTTARRTRPDVIYWRDGIFSKEQVLRRKFGVPVVKEINGICADEVKIDTRPDRLSMSIFAAFERRDLRRADRYVTVTPRLKEVLHSEYGVPDEKITAIENGANTDLFKPMPGNEAKRQAGLQEEARYVSFVGAFSRWQGIEFLIRAFPLVLKECPDARALLVGDGELKEELVEQASRLGIADKVIFTGTVPYERVPMYVNAGDICVVPKVPLKSGYSPLKLCEYMACSRPVIATRTSGFELLEENNAGMLVNPEDPQEFAGAIVKLLKQPALRQRMGESGRKYVLENRSWASVAMRVADVCRAAIRECQGRGTGK